MDVIGIHVILFDNDALYLFSLLWLAWVLFVRKMLGWVIKKVDWVGLHGSSKLLDVIGIHVDGFDNAALYLFSLLGLGWVLFVRKMLDRVVNKVDWVGLGPAPVSTSTGASTRRCWTRASWSRAAP